MRPIILMHLDSDAKIFGEAVIRLECYPPAVTLSVETKSRIRKFIQGHNQLNERLSPAVVTSLQLLHVRARSGTARPAVGHGEDVENIRKLTR